MIIQYCYGFPYGYECFSLIREGLCLLSPERDSANSPLWSQSSLEFVQNLAHFSTRFVYIHSIFHSQFRGCSKCSIHLKFLDPYHRMLIDPHQGVLRISIPHRAQDGMWITEKDALREYDLRFNALFL